MQTKVPELDNSNSGADHSVWIFVMVLALVVRHSHILLLRRA